MKIQLFHFTRIPGCNKTKKISEINKINFFFFFYYLLGLRATLHLWFLWKKNIQKIDDYDKKSGIHNTIIRVSTYYQNNQLIRLKKIGVRQGIGIR
jgi:hypothetical protein